MTFSTRQELDDRSYQTLVQMMQSQAYRELAGDSLLDGRRAALELMAETVDGERLSAEEADAWLRALNDLRLVLGTRLDVQEDTFASDLRPDDPNAPALAVYGWLSWQQEQLVAVLIPGSEGETGPWS